MGSSARVHALLRRRRSAPQLWRAASLDSRTPGPSQIGAVWLPVPHMLDAALRAVRLAVAQRAGGRDPRGALLRRRRAIPVSPPRAGSTETAAAAAATLCVFALNPNLLYLQSTPMTEPVLAGTLARAALLQRAVPGDAIPGVGRGRGRCGHGHGAGALRGLVPDSAPHALLLGRRPAPPVRRPRACLARLASLGPLLWLAHNWWYWGDALEFYRGPYSAHGHLPEAARCRHEPLPGRPRLAMTPRSTTGTPCGWRRAGPVLWLGMAGMLAACFKRALLAGAAAGHADSAHYQQHPLGRHSHLHAAPVAVLLLEHALRSDGAAGAGIRRGRAGGACAGATPRRLPGC